MIGKMHLSWILIAFMALAGCVKETYDMKMLSKKAQLSPTLGLAAIKGDITLSDIVEPNDTVVFGPDKLIKIVFSEDSVVDLTMADIYDLSNMVTFSRSYTIGEADINPFNTVNNFLLRDVAGRLTEPGRSAFLALDNTTSPFPAFPQVSMNETVFPLISNIEYATFASGTIVFSVKNNMGAPLNGFTVSLYNTTGHVLIGSASSANLIPSGTTGTATINLANKTVTNSITAAFTLGGSSGNATPSLIDLDTRGLEATISGTGLTISSGKVILPSQTITAQNSTDVITFDPGTGIELDEIKLTTGTINYSIAAPFTVSGTLDFRMPSTLRNGAPVSNVIPINGTMTTGSIPVSNTVFDLGTNPVKPYNELPVVYSFAVSSSGSMVIFNSTDAITVNLSLPDPGFDYVKGYFGRQTEAIPVEIMDLEIDDILSKISGTFLVASPLIKLNYSNSFSVPMKIDLNATGRKGTQTVDLGLDSISIAYPQYPARDITSSFTIDKNNSALPQLISLPPSQIEFSGTAVANPAGKGTRDNYIFGDSRFIGSLEVEVPMEFRFTNFQFADTVDNFLKEEAGSDNPVNPENFNLLRLNVTAENGFPLGVSMSMSLYNPVTRTKLKTVNATDFLKPAAVDNTGKVSAVTQSQTAIEFTKEFFDDVNKAEKIIFSFNLNTTGTNPVRFYSDYGIKFKAAFVWKPDIVIDLK